MKNLNKRRLAIILIPLIAFSSIVTIYAYIVSIQLTGTVHVPGYDIVSYDPSAYENYELLTEVTNLVDFNGFYGIGLTSPDFSSEITGCVTRRSTLIA